MEQQLFCKVCDNIYSIITTNNKLYFKCQKCKTAVEPNVIDTLRYEAKSISRIIYGTLLKNAGKDPVNPKVIKECPQCKYTISKQIRVGNDMRLINTCTKCDYQWLEGVNT